MYRAPPPSQPIPPRRAGASQGMTTGALYGDGTYFARDASYSLDYACTMPSGQRRMLVAEVGGPLFAACASTRRRMRVPQRLVHERPGARTCITRPPASIWGLSHPSPTFFPLLLRDLFFTANPACLLLIPTCLLPYRLFSLPLPQLLLPAAPGPSAVSRDHMGPIRRPIAGASRSSAVGSHLKGPFQIQDDGIEISDLRPWPRRQQYPNLPLPRAPPPLLRTRRW